MTLQWKKEAESEGKTLNPRKKKINEENIHTEGTGAAEV